MLFLQTVFKRLYKNSGRERGTLKFFREKLNRRNVTLDVKHYEDCEQFFVSVGKCFIIKALLEFFQMPDTKHDAPVANAPHGGHVISEAQKQNYITSTLDKFLDEYIFYDRNDEAKCFQADGVLSYSVNVMKSFLLLADFKDAVATGNGHYLSILRKQMLVHFFSTPGFNEYAIEMLINIMQCQILLSEAQAHHCKWAATVNWNGGFRKNIEIDLFQENRNSDMKKLIRSMGANKTDKAIERASKASGGVKKIVESVEKQVNMHRRSSSHSHRSSVDDEVVILAALRVLRPFKIEDGRAFESFVDISDDPTHSFDDAKFKVWVNRHKNNILMHYPVSDDTEHSDDDEIGSDATSLNC